MNEKFMDFFITLAPTLLTSVTAFLIGRYNNFQNRPLDKMELAYNRVYYPVYRIMREDSIEISTVIEKTKKYFCKYEKYIDRSTTMIYKQLCECTAMEEQERIYSTFCDNIHDNCIYLRKKLGYTTRIFSNLSILANEDKNADSYSIRIYSMLLLRMYFFICKSRKNKRDLFSIFYDWFVCNICGTHIFIDSENV